MKGSVSPALERHPDRPLVRPVAARRRAALPAATCRSFPTAIEQFDFDAFDLVISTSHCAAKSVVVPGRARHVCYCHSPMRYAWDQFDAYFGPAQVGAAAVAPAAAGPGAAGALGRRDRGPCRPLSWRTPIMLRAESADTIIARSTVVYPPVNTDFYEPDPARRPEYFLVVSAMVPYKRLDMAIRACALAGVPLKIVGRGPEEARLRAMARPGRRVPGMDQRRRRPAAVPGSHAVLMPGVEDFGMVPVEAQACGRPSLR